jgi:WD40 repeat protein
MGNVRIFDTRKPMSVHQWTASDRPATINIHPELNFIACGKQSINIHDTNGRQLTTVRSNEGFRSSRMALTTCLSFHPYRMCLAAGFADHTVSVFTAASRA